MKMELNVMKQKKAIVNTADIVSVYSGTAHICMCGCSGIYYYAKQHQIYAGEKRGYIVTDNEVNDKMVEKVAKIFSEFKGKIECIDDYIYTIIIDNRQYTIYLKEVSK